MSDVRELYQEIILDHGRRPRNFGRLEGATHHAEGYNPLCGDRLEVFFIIEGGVVRDVSFEGSGCAISTSSASLMTEALKGRSIEDAMVLFARVHALMTGADGGPEAATGAKAERFGEPAAGEQGGGPPAAGLAAGLGKLSVFEGVRQFPLRVKCATLAWHAMNAALEQGGEVVSTE